MQKRVKRNYWYELYESFRRVFGWLAALLGIVISFALWILDPAETISIKLAVPLGVGLFILVASLVDLSIRFFKLASKSSPKVLAGIKASANNNLSIAIILLEPSELFNHESVVSIYIKENNFEILFGMGHVFTVQEDGKIQILVTRIEESQRDKIDRLTGNDATLLEAILIKPSLPRSYLEIDI